ncbi:hypothetical protein HK102_010471, partial [Quaeritorhiza haematococci]
MADYEHEMLETLRKSVDQVRADMNWQRREPVRLVFHAFKPLKDAETEAVKRLMAELGDYDVDYAFLHVVEDHPYLLFDEAQEGMRDFESGMQKGVLAPQRGLFFRISGKDVLIALTGPKDVKRAQDGIPRPSFVAQLLSVASAGHHPLLGVDREAAGRTLETPQLGSRRHARPHRPHEVVPMSEAERILLEDARSTLIRAVRKVEGRGDLREAFAGWALRESVSGVAIEGACRAAVDRTVAQRTYRDVAVLGYAADAWRSNFAHRDLLERRLEWLAGRNPNMGGNPAGFCSDPIALLGVALGAQAIGRGALTDGIAAWLDGFSGASFNSPRVPGRDKLFAAASLRSVGAKVVIDVPDADEVSDVRVALRARGLLPPVHKITDEAEAVLVLRLVLESSEDLDPLVAAVRLAAVGAVKDAVRSKAVSSLDPLSSDVPAGEAPIRAFISYAWEEDPQHNENALALAHRLRQMGVEAVIDRYVDGTPDEGWPIWMIHQ